MWKRFLVLLSLLLNMRLSLFTLAEAVLVGISTQQRKLLYHNSFPCPISASSSKVIRGKHAIKV